MNQKHSLFALVFIAGSLSVHGVLYQSKSSLLWALAVWLVVLAVSLVQSYIDYGNN